MKYIVTLINFGSRLYDGMNILEAIEAAENCGFEASLAAIYDGQIIEHVVYSPLNGWTE
jgi:hypothetical protein